MSYIVPIGPYHPALEEPVHARLYTEGEEIKDAEVFIGYNHRGIEKLAQQKNFIQTLVMVERVCGICSHSHAFAYAMALESIAKMNVPKRGQYIRVITAELERLHSHYLWLGIALHIIGHDSLFMHTWDDREAIMDILGSYGFKEPFHIEFLREGRIRLHYENSFLSEAVRRS